MLQVSRVASRWYSASPASWCMRRGTFTNSHTNGHSRVVRVQRRFDSSKASNNVHGSKASKSESAEALVKPKEESLRVTGSSSYFFTDRQSKLSWWRRRLAQAFERIELKAYNEAKFLQRLQQYHERHPAWPRSDLTRWEYIRLSPGTESTVLAVLGAFAFLLALGTHREKAGRALSRNWPATIGVVNDVDVECIGLPGSTKTTAAVSDPESYTDDFVFLWDKQQRSDKVARAQATVLEYLTAAEFEELIRQSQEEHRVEKAAAAEEEKRKKEHGGHFGFLKRLPIFKKSKKDDVNDEDKKEEKVVEGAKPSAEPKGAALGDDDADATGQAVTVAPTKSSADSNTSEPRKNETSGSTEQGTTDCAEASVEPDPQPEPKPTEEEKKRTERNARCRSAAPHAHRVVCEYDYVVPAAGDGPPVVKTSHYFWRFHQSVVLSSTRDHAEGTVDERIKPGSTVVVHYNPQDSDEAILLKGVIPADAVAGVAIGVAMVFMFASFSRSYFKFRVYKMMRLLQFSY
eukprot:Clim_evm14s214 gene=Clim_evmTU14s214